MTGVARWLSLAMLSLVACGKTSATGPALEAAGGSPSDGTGGAATGLAGAAQAGASPSSEFPGYLTGAPIFTRAQRLTNSQFEHAVTDILGLPAAASLREGLVEAVAGVTTFTNNESVLAMDSETTLAFEAAVEKAAALVTENYVLLENLNVGEDVPAFIRRLGRRAFRRPLTEDEVTRFVVIFARGRELYGRDSTNGVSLLIRAMLQSPSFLYRTELGEAGEPLSGYEIAAKLSFWLLDTTPSDALLDAAAAGELDDPDKLVAAARAMLEEPAASAMMRDFHQQMYRLDRFEKNAGPDERPVDEAFAAEAKEASLLFFESLFQRGLGVRNIFTYTRGFVGPMLAPYYGQPIPATLEERELGPERLGYFMQIPPLMGSLPDGEPDLISRGMRILTQAMCASLGPPAILFPPLPPRKPGQTNRQRTVEATESCGKVCHALIDPPGFAFEGFDGTGKARDTDEGLPIDASGAFPFSSGSSTFTDGRDFARQLAEDDHVYACYGQRLAIYGLQREMTPDDTPLIDDLTVAGRSGSIKELVLAIVRHPSFRLRHEDLP